MQDAYTFKSAKYILMVVFALLSLLIAMVLWSVGKVLVRLAYAGLVSAGVLAGSGGSSPLSPKTVTVTPVAVKVPEAVKASPNLTPSPSSPSISSAKVMDAADAEFEF